MPTETTIDSTADAADKRPGSSEALHHHYLVPADRRAAFSAIIERSLANYPKPAVRAGVPEEPPAPTAGANGVLPFTGTFLVLSDTPEDCHWISPDTLHREMVHMKELGLSVLGVPLLDTARFASHHRIVIAYFAHAAGVP